MTQAWLVLKFGGTSVSGKPQWDGIASLARQRLDDGYRVLLVCSAVSGVTDALQALADDAEYYDPTKVDALLRLHSELSEELQITVDDLLREAGEEITRRLKQIADAADQAGRFPAVAALISVGEWLSTQIGQRYLARSLSVEWVDAREALTALGEADTSGRRAWLSARCGSGDDLDLLASWTAKARLLIVQGFVASHPEGGTALLGRGGSDTSAALLAGRLGADKIEIWTDVPGLFSADPRIIPGARLLNTLNYDEALEMAASGAKVVHSRCIRAAADANIPILIRDLARTEFPGTLICGDDASIRQGAEVIRSVCHQPHMTVLLLMYIQKKKIR